MMFEHYITLNSWVWLVTEEVLSLPPPNPAPANQEQDWKTLTNERSGLAQVVGAGAGWGQLSWSVDRGLCILFPLNLLSYVCSVTTSQWWSEVKLKHICQSRKNSNKSVKQMKSYKKWPGFAKLLNLFFFSPFPNEYIHFETQGHCTCVVCVNAFITHWWLNNQSLLKS